MSEKNSPGTLSTNFTDQGYARFEAVWLARGSGDPPPDWRHYLPALNEPCSPDLILMLLKVDIECRVKAGMPALLSERYFEHPRLRQEDARLDARQQIELIQWEYEQRWQHGQPARRTEYEAAFPQHADAVRQLTPRSRCPKCRRIVTLEETCLTFVCPSCEGESFAIGAPSPSVAEDKAPALDLRTYELIEPLGRGGMGEVYRSSDPALGRDLAVKVIKAEHRGHPAIERRFLREARITGSLQHPGIVAVYNMGRLPDGRLHYTMRLVRGRTFADILQEEAGKPERLPSLLEIFKNICQAVGYAHSKRVIHRDLKPHNVMVGRFGEVQVMDWGLAKLLTSDEEEAETEEMPDAAGTHIHTEPADTPLDVTRRGSEFGSPPYMPPEQALGEWSMVDERADVFALGSILCELLTGKPVYTSSTRAEVLWKAKRGDVTEALARLEQCGADVVLKALCRACLALDFQQRPRDAGVVAQRVAEYQADVQERLRKAELERVAAETRAQEEQARAVVAQEWTRETLARVAAERKARRRLLGLEAVMVVFVLVVGMRLANDYRRVQEDQRRTQGALQEEQRRTQVGLKMLAEWFPGAEWFTEEGGFEDITIVGIPLERYVLALSNQKIQPDDAVFKPYQLSSNDLDKLARLLVKKRSKAHLTETEKWLCAVSASLLDLNGRPVEDQDRWTGDAYLDRVYARIAGEAKLMEKPIELKRDSTLFLLVADMAYVRRDWAAAIKIYERYLAIAERNSSLKDVMGEDTLATAIKRAGNTYLERADALADEGKVKEATDDRSAAYRLYGRFNNIAIAGTDLDIRPDENKKPKDWLEKIKEAGKAQSEARRDGTLWLHNENSSFMYYRLIKVDKPNEICFRWRWRLDDSPPGARDPDGISSLHPLAVIVVFLDGQKLIALNYVWDPLEPTGKSWIVRQSKDKFKFGQDEYETEYPHIVVASKSDPLRAWQTCTRDVAADYRMIYKRDPPPIRAVAIQTGCMDGPPNQKRVVEGSVAGLQFDRKVNGRCPEPLPR